MKTRTSFQKGHENVYKATGSNHHQYKHGRASTKKRDPIYAAWSRMKRRCMNPNAKEYPRYGGVGIKVCERWLHFGNFMEDMGSSWSPGLSIDRIDNTKGYEPGNCRWATFLEQQRNKRSVRKYEWEGRMLTIPELAVALGLKPDTLYRQLQRHKFDLNSLMKSYA